VFVPESGPRDSLGVDGETVSAVPWWGPSAIGAVSALLVLVGGAVLQTLREARNRRNDRDQRWDEKRLEVCLEVLSDPHWQAATLHNLAYMVADADPAAGRLVAFDPAAPRELAGLLMKGWPKVQLYGSEGLRNAWWRNIEVLLQSSKELDREARSPHLRTVNMQFGEHDVDIRVNDPQLALEVVERVTKVQAELVSAMQKELGIRFD
jgi:hypothetical protein